MTVRFTGRTFLLAGVVLASIVAAILIAEFVVPDGKLKELLEQAAIALVFGAVLGGVVKLVIEDIDRARQQRTERVRFIENLLAALKGAFDRVERSRVLISAHRSAKTYGDEMRELIDARVVLLNVSRALVGGADDIEQTRRVELTKAVESMEQYLAGLTDEFRDSFKPIADMQRAYEVRTEAQLEALGAEAKAEDSGFRNDAWENLQSLAALSDFVADGPKEAVGDDPRSGSGYQQRFVRELDEASRILRLEARDFRRG